MVGKATLQVYEFEKIEDYYDYIMTSFDNGQHIQVKSLIKDLSPQQKKDCLKYLIFSDNYIAMDVEYVSNIIIDSF